MSVDASTGSLKFRMTGALIWLVALIIIVPIWYGHPVNFSPDSEQTVAESKQESVVVEKPFVLPTTPNQPQLSTTAKKAETSSVQPLNQAPELSATAAKSSSLTRMKPAKKASSAIQDNNVHTADTSTLPKIEKKSLASASSKWIIRLAAYRSKEKANLLYEHLKYDYDVFVKFFPKSQYYSVRIGPYTDKKLAIKDQTELNRVLRVRSQLTKIE